MTFIHSHNHTNHKDKMWNIITCEIQLTDKHYTSSVPVPENVSDLSLLWNVLNKKDDVAGVSIYCEQCCRLVHLMYILPFICSSSKGRLTRATLIYWQIIKGPATIQNIVPLIKMTVDHWLTNDVMAELMLAFTCLHPTMWILIQGTN